LVFIDDNPNERELIKQVLPEVLTVDLPRDPQALPAKMLEDMTDFDLLALTKKTRREVALYQANAKRQAAKTRLPRSMIPAIAGNSSCDRSRVSRCA
jgi:predicted enzyme involved in methoxymalonyl-ACP biosynthesis